MEDFDASGQPRPTITAPPDGELFPGPSALHRQAQYQAMQQWPTGAGAPSIRAADPTANEPVVRQVAGGNHATQYMSTSKDVVIACTACAYDWSAAGGLGRLRSPRRWGPVIQIDVTRLSTGRQRLYDLSDDGPHRDRLFQEGRTPQNATDIQAIAAMARRDSEVLVEGDIPPAAIVHTFSVPECVQVLLRGKPSFLEDLRRCVLDHGRVSNATDRQILQDAGVLDLVEGRGQPMLSSASSSAPSPSASLSSASLSSASSSSASLSLPTPQAMDEGTAKKPIQDDDEDEGANAAAIASSLRRQRNASGARRKRGMQFSSAPRSAALQSGFNTGDRVSFSGRIGRVYSMTPDGRCVVNFDDGGNDTVDPTLLELHHD
jgi:hypothetical protein